MNIYTHPSTPWAVGMFDISEYRVYNVILNLILVYVQKEAHQDTEAIFTVFIEVPGHLLQFFFYHRTHRF